MSRTSDQLRFGHLIHDITAGILLDHKDVLENLSSVIHHPRSLARPVASWRPPILELPGEDYASTLQTTITRRRVGPQAIAFLSEHVANSPTPAYLISLRITHPDAGVLPRRRAEAWVRALVGKKANECVHYVEGTRAMIFFWLVDAHFRPLVSPAAMFADAPLAA